MTKCVHSGCNGTGFPEAKCDTCASVWRKMEAVPALIIKNEQVDSTVQLAKVAVKARFCSRTRGDNPRRRN